jgi:hypothetical protein
MRLICLSLLWFALACGMATSVLAVDFFFEPDTISANIGDVIQLAGRIGPSDTVRGFTIYLVYDTNLVDLVPPPLPGTLIANRAGLDFRYSDHIPVAPNRLEIGATVFSTDYWSGPGEIFRMNLAVRRCANVAMTAEVGFRRPNAQYIPGVFYPSVIQICPASPLPPIGLMINIFEPGMTTLCWNRVQMDSLGRPIIAPLLYRVFQQQIQPVLQSPVLLITVADTMITFSRDAAVENVYQVKAATNP